ncbi:MAG: glycoside hydrolase family 1 protein [Erysipelotrichaceae bacterium]
MTRILPDNFVWGAGSAAYQVEGGWNEGGKGVSNWDVFANLPGRTFEGTNGNVAADHYHKYKEDVQLMHEMGLKSYRFSISWSRIYPDDMNHVNKEGVKFYSDLIDSLNEYGIEPFVTLFHWDLPQYLEEIGGWENEEVLFAFEKYAKTCFEIFGNRVAYWTTFNETLEFIMSGYMAGDFPPEVSDPKRFIQVTHNVHVAHALAVKQFRKILPDGKIGIANVLDPMYPASNKKEDIEAFELAEACYTHWFYDPVIFGEYPDWLLKLSQERYQVPIIKNWEAELLKATKIDFIGVNFYRRKLVAANPDESNFKTNTTGIKGSSKPFGFKNYFKFVTDPNARYTDWDWEIYPEGLHEGMKRIHARYGDIPIYVTENGLGSKDILENGLIHDNYRIDYIDEHIDAIAEAIAEGIDCRGYFVWSFTDLLSWLNGYKKQYGFVYIDREDGLKRYKKDSFYWYKNIINTKGRKKGDYNEI